MCENLVWIGWNRRYVNFLGEGERSPLLGTGYMWLAMPIFELVRAIPVKSHMWKFGSDWLSLSRVMVSTDKKKIIEFSGGGRKPLLGGVTFDIWCPFSNSDELFQSKVMCENLACIGSIRRYVKFRGEGGRSPLLSGVTCDRLCPFSYMAELFRLKFLCENLVLIGWVFQELSCKQTKI